jgi:hypothetical protein
MTCISQLESIYVLLEIYLEYEHNRFTFSQMQCEMFEETH